jgi:hypothetical protein
MLSLWFGQDNVKTKNSANKVWSPMHNVILVSWVTAKLPAQ